MGKFEQNETKQIRSTEPIRKDVGGFKGKIEIVLKKTNRNCVWERKESKQTKDTKHQNFIDIWVLFETEEGQKERRKLQKRITREIRTFWNTIKILILLKE